MDPNFRHGFEKTAILGSAVAGLGRFMAKQMPKIFRRATTKAGKFSAGRTAGSALTGFFVLDEAGNVVRKTRQQVNRPTYISQLA